MISRCNPPEVLLRKGVLKIYRKFTRELQCRSCFSTLLKSHFGMDILPQICCIFSEHLFVRKPLECCFWTSLKLMKTNEVLRGLRYPTLKKSIRKGTIPATVLTDIVLTYIVKNWLIWWIVVSKNDYSLINWK